MARRDIITIGGSAGSLSFLSKLVRELPRNIPAAMFVIVHLTSRGSSELARLLNLAGGPHAVEASDNQKIEPGRIYVAARDRHMLLAEGHIHLSRGPKEGLHRPSINATFRSAAYSYGERVIGVLLSGMLDDGASGLWEIVQHHGISIIQDPGEAQFPSMPVNALKDVPINYKLRVDEMAPRLTMLVNSNGELPVPGQEFINELSREEFSGFTCPECRGPLYRHRKRPPEFKCRVGHVFPLQTLIDESTSTEERKMYEAVVSLEEGADMAEFAARDVEPTEQARLKCEADQLRRHANTIRKLIEERWTSPLND